MGKTTEDEKRVKLYAFRLHEDDKTVGWDAITERLKTEGYRNDKREPFNKGALQVAYSRWVKAGRPGAELMSAQASSVTPEEPKTEETVIQSETSETGTPDVRQGTPPVTQPEGGDAEPQSTSVDESYICLPLAAEVVRQGADSVILNLNGIPDGDSVIQGKPQEQVVEPVIHEQAGVLQLPSETVNELLAMLKWWKEERGKPMTAASVETLRERPEFFRGTGEDKAIPKTIRLSKELVRDAERYARAHKTVTGGNFSGLVELLLWQALGSDKKYLKPETEETDES